MNPATTAVPVEQFAALRGLPVRHGFVGRVPGVDVATDRAAALARLDEHHRRARVDLGMGDRELVTAQQVHGTAVAVLSAGEPLPERPISGVDGLVTDRADVCLGIYVADCGPLYLVDPVRRAVGLVHSGRKGTEGNIAAEAVRALAERFGSRPADLVAQLGPCIRPPWYEVDFAGEIVRQCRAAGIGRVEDGGTCTAAEPERYYSYRREKGHTGRMLALLALA
ncbi:MAG: polyphenol oxidase family protein [Gluconacetobacter diazotrophicus]|nr:polyphenol oxidase family protein [Gluconacetobacter diazotrophicus]